MRYHHAAGTTPPPSAPSPAPSSRSTHQGAEQPIARPLVAALVVGELARLALDGTTADGLSFGWVWCRRRSELLAAARKIPGVRAVLTDLWDADGRPTAPAVRYIRESVPTLPIVAVCRLTPLASREVVRHTRAGVAAVAFHDHDDIGATLRYVMSSGA
jgi:hypothetical protein